MRCLIIFIATSLLLSTCSDQKKSGKIIEPAFYHWKSVFNPTASDLATLKTNGSNTIYLRFFDVAWDETYLKPSPIAQVRIADSYFIKSNQLQIIPTVFITNECIKNIQTEQCNSLAENILKLINEIAFVNSIGAIKEIQIDCDWTASTKEKYFSLLTKLQQIDTQHLYSATIRLFQVKYAKEAGIPPVKKGLLMCYNMINLKKLETKNSIIDPEEIKKYTGKLDQYPLALDVALPVFGWYVLFRKNTYAGLIQNLNDDSLNQYAMKLAQNRFAINKDVVLNNTAFKKGDLLRYEGSSYTDIMAAASVLNQKINTDSFRVVLFHLDSLILSKYSVHEIKNIFRSLH